METDNIVERILISDKASELINKLRERNGPLMFHQSGGCCDGSSPMCYLDGEFLVGAQDVWLGRVNECDFYMSRDQFEYWKHTQLTLDVTEGRGASFSLEIPYGVRFVILSRMFKDDELNHLSEIRFGDKI